MKEPKISVIVPVYNAGQYLEPLINSICNQTWKNLELILVDDGSTDGSGEVCDTAAVEDPRVRVIHKINAGQSAARNTGLEVARGDVIAFADHDDLLHPRAYEYMLGAMEKLNTSVCICDFLNVQQSDIEGICFSEKIPEVTLMECPEWIHDIFRPSWRTPIWNKLYRREVLEDIRFGDLRLGEDNLVSYQVIKKARRAAFVHETLYFQRMHGDNFEYTGIRYFTDLLRAKEMILQDSKQTFPEEHSHFRKLFLYECIRIHNAYIDCGDAQYEPQRKETLSILKRNAKNIWSLDMPLGHKVLFTKLRLSKIKNVNNRIYI